LSERVKVEFELKKEIWENLQNFAKNHFNGNVSDALDFLLVGGSVLKRAEEFPELLELLQKLKRCGAGDKT
jgi:hypothetical protein